MVRRVDCSYCHKAAKLVGGDVIYPHRPDLKHLKFWRCEDCDAHVGCHKPNRKYGQDGTAPLGRLANKELRAAKQRAHAAFDPLWKDGPMSRGEAYQWLSDKLHLPVSETHIGEFDVTLCNRVVEVCLKFKWR